VRPVDAVVGDAVTGGTIALTGRLVVRADKVGVDTQLAHRPDIGSLIWMRNQIKID